MSSWVKVTCTKFDQGVKAVGIVRNSSTGTAILLNCANMSQVATRATTKSKFRYVFNKYDRRESSSYCETESTVASLLTAADVSPASNWIDLPVYPNQDITKSTVTKYFNVESFAYAVLDGSSSDRSYFTYAEGTVLKTVLVSYDLDDILDILVGGVTTTSTTSS